MNRGSRISLFLVLVIAMVVVLMVWPREPSYNGRKLSRWLEAYDAASNTTEKQLATEAVRALGPKAIPALLRMLRTTDSKLTTKARTWMRDAWGVSYTPSYEYVNRGVVGFRALGPVAKPAISELLPLLRRRDSAWAAADVLAMFGPETMPFLRAGLTNQNDWSRAASAFGLGKQGSNALPAVPDLLVRLNDRDSRVRFEAIYALDRIGPATDGILSAVIRRIDDPDRLVRALVITVVRRIGEEELAEKPDSRRRTGWNERIVPALVSRFEDPDTFVRLYAIRAVGKVCRSPSAAAAFGPAVTPVMVTQLQNADSAVRCSAAEVLGLFGTQATSAVPALLRLTLREQEHERRVRDAAADALQAIDPDHWPKREPTGP